MEKVSLRGGTLPSPQPRRPPPRGTPEPGSPEPGSPRETLPGSPPRRPPRSTPANLGVHAGHSPAHRPAGPRRAPLNPGAHGGHSPARRPAGPHGAPPPTREPTRDTPRSCSRLTKASDAGRDHLWRTSASAPFPPGPLASGLGAAPPTRRGPTRPRAPRSLHVLTLALSLARSVLTGPAQPPQSRAAASTLASASQALHCPQQPPRPALDPAPRRGRAVDWPEGRQGRASPAGGLNGQDRVLIGERTEKGRDQTGVTWSINRCRALLVGGRRLAEPGKVLGEAGLAGRGLGSLGGASAGRAGLRPERGLGLLGGARSWAGSRLAARG
ncbi:hypothetical protein P7K49_013223 [Saguinus oedipus]|uniref:Uncharacterized protein n=1 Tax=Saguinus oedipus TaxID=9490 RepID=A0ABQ9VFE3_SAGOE|nr:hypothetical protein P7K49_013223 [Saguinus oedipus]